MTTVFAAHSLILRLDINQLLRQKTTRDAGKFQIAVSAIFHRKSPFVFDNSSYQIGEIKHKEIYYPL